MTNHIPTGHPVRSLLRAAAHNDLERGTLDSHLNEWDARLPEGSSLSKYRSSIISKSREIRALGESGQNARAQRLADDYANELAGRMTDAERRVIGDANPESLDETAARMFGH